MRDKKQHNSARKNRLTDRRLLMRAQKPGKSKKSAPRMQTDQTGGRAKRWFFYFLQKKFAFRPHH